VPKDLSEHAVAPLRCTGVAAEPGAVVHPRSQFQAWLVQNFIVDAERLSSITLAVNEALANSVEHAYVTYDRPGSVDVRADHDEADSVVVVEVADHGRWREPAPDPLHLRGRGIPLIKALSDKAVIEKSNRGTKVTMSWNGLSRR